MLIQIYSANKSEQAECLWTQRERERKKEKPITWISYTLSAWLIPVRCMHSIQLSSRACSLSRVPEEPSRSEHHMLCEDTHKHVHIHTHAAHRIRGYRWTHSFDNYTYGLRRTCTQTRAVSKIFSGVDKCWETRDIPIRHIKQMAWLGLVVFPPFVFQEREDGQQLIVI